MVKKTYEWSADGTPARIAQHSVAKHEVLKAYLFEYLQTLVSSPHQDAMRVTLVDGFAGGGVYSHEDTGERVLGSPFAFLNTVRDAQALMSVQRTKPLQMLVDYIFVEKHPDGFASLQKTLREEGFGDRFGTDIHLHRGGFEDHAASIIQFIKGKSPRKGRSLFLLDQYGYSDVPLSTIRNILSELPRSEVILTFAVDSFINFVSDTPQSRSTLQSMGIPDVFQGRSVREGFTPVITDTYEKADSGPEECSCRSEGSSVRSSSVVRLSRPGGRASAVLRWRVSLGSVTPC